MNTWHGLKDLIQTPASSLTNGLVNSRPIASVATVSTKFMGYKILTVNFRISPAEAACKSIAATCTVLPA